MNKDLKFEKQGNEIYAVHGTERVPIRENSNKVTVGDEEITMLSLAEKLAENQTAGGQNTSQAQNEQGQRGADQSQKTERSPTLNR